MKCERKGKKMNKTGKWEKDPASSDIAYDVYKCSLCGKQIIVNPQTSITDIYDENKFCRECGARMEDTSN